MSPIEIEIRLKRYPAVGRAGAHVALKDFRLDLRQGEFICVFGPSGCGKTTLLNIVAGLDRDFDGRVKLGVNAGDANPVIGYVFQNPRLLPWSTVAENIELVLNREQRGSGIVDELIAATGLEDARHVYASRLSAGMSRRVALARAFAVRPELLLMDEPFVSLDQPTAQRLRLLLLDIWRGRPTTVLFITHDLREAIMISDRIVFLSASPGTVVVDVPVDIPHHRRADEDAIEAFRAVLIERNSALFEAPG